MLETPQKGWRRRAPACCLAALIFIATNVSAQDMPTVASARKRINLIGYTRSRAKQTLASEVSGKVLRVNYDVGQAIGNAPFLEMDPVFIGFQIEQTELTLKKLEVARSRNASQAAYLEKEFRRIDQLHAGNVATQSNWDAAAEALEQARLALQTTEQELKTLAVQLREMKERLRRHRLMAPQGWIVIERRVEPGEIIATGTPLAMVADFTQLVVPLFVSGPEMEAIRRTERLKVKVAGQPAHANINWVNPEFDERTRKWAVELALIDYQGEAMGGLQVELAIDVAGGGLMVPRNSVTRRYDNPFVVLQADGRKVPIVILGETDHQILIADQPDLKPGMALKRTPQPND